MIPSAIFIAQLHADTWWWHFGPGIAQGGIQAFGLLLSLVATLRWYRIKQQQDREDADRKHQNELQLELKKLRDERTLTVKKDAFVKWLSEINLLAETFVDFDTTTVNFAAENTARSVIQLVATASTYEAVANATKVLLDVIGVRDDERKKMIDSEGIADIGDLIQSQSEARSIVAQEAREFSYALDEAIKAFRKELPVAL